MNASELLAQAHGKKCRGAWSCRFCGAACTQDIGWWLWPPQVEFTRVRSSQYVCHGCQLYRRQRITLYFLDGSYKDRQDPANWSWILTDTGLTALRRPNEPDLKGILLKPPLRFALSLTTGARNLIQQAVVNSNMEVRGDTQLTFTLDGKELCWSPYELEEAIATGRLQGKEPGVRALALMLGVEERPEEPSPSSMPGGDDLPILGSEPVRKRGRGRPIQSENKPYRTVTYSGAVTVI